MKISVTLDGCELTLIYTLSVINYTGIVQEVFPLSIGASGHRNNELRRMVDTEERFRQERTHMRPLHGNFQFLQP